MNKSLPARRDQPLVCRIEREQLVIRIGIDTLAFCSEPQNGGTLPSMARVIDNREWASDVAREIMREEEDGSTVLTKMIDGAQEAAFNNGSIGIDYP